MSEGREIRINKVLRELNISLDRAVDFLKDKGHENSSQVQMLRYLKRSIKSYVVNFLLTKGIRKPLLK